MHQRHFSTFQNHTRTLFNVTKLTFQVNGQVINRCFITTGVAKNGGESMIDQLFRPPLSPSDK